MYGKIDLSSLDQRMREKKEGSPRGQGASRTLSSPRKVGAAESARLPASPAPKVVPQAALRSSRRRPSSGFGAPTALPKTPDAPNSPEAKKADNFGEEEQEEQVLWGDEVVPEGDNVLDSPRKPTRPLLAGTFPSIVNVMLSTSATERQVRAFLSSYRLYASPRRLFTAIEQRCMALEALRKNVRGPDAGAIFRLMRAWVEICYHQDLGHDVRLRCELIELLRRIASWNGCLLDTNVIKLLMIRQSSHAGAVRRHRSALRRLRGKLSKQLRSARHRSSRSGSAPTMSSGTEVGGTLPPEVERQLAQLEALQGQRLGTPQSTGGFSDEDSSGESAPHISEQFSGRDVAQQLAMMDSALFCDINLSELHRCNWKRDDKDILSPNVLRMIRAFETTGKWVATQIALAPSSKARVDRMRFFINVAWYSRKLLSYQCMFGVLSGLQADSVERMKAEWALVPEKYMLRLQELRELASFRGNYRNYRAALRAVPQGEPCVPFMAVLLKDLFAIEENNEDYVRRMINFEKMMLTGEVLDTVTLLRRTTHLVELEQCDQIERELIGIHRSCVELDSLSSIVAANVDDPAACATAVAAAVDAAIAALPPDEPPIIHRRRSDSVESVERSARRLALHGSNPPLSSLTFSSSSDSDGEFSARGTRGQRPSRALPADPVTKPRSHSVEDRDTASASLVQHPIKQRALTAKPTPIAIKPVAIKPVPVAAPVSLPLPIAFDDDDDDTIN